MTVKTAHVRRNTEIYVSVEQMLLVEDGILNLLNVGEFDPGMTCDCGNIVRRCPDRGIGIICRTSESSSSGSRLAQSTLCGKEGEPKIGVPLHRWAGERKQQRQHDGEQSSHTFRPCGGQS